MNTNNVVEGNAEQIIDLAGQVGPALQAKGWFLSTAEFCTGGSVS